MTFPVSAALLLGALGAPLFVVILLIAIVGFMAQNVDLAILPLELMRIADTSLLVAIPFFTYAGYVLSASNTSTRLLNLVQSLLGWMPGGLAIVGLIACAFFTALTGASGVTIVALGALFLPSLIKNGYNEKFSLGLVTSGGSLGLLLPPALPLILYGVIAQQIEASQGMVSIQDLFIAGVAPSALMIVLLGLYTMWDTRKEKIKKQPFKIKTFYNALNAAKWELPLPVVVLGGIFSGWFAVSETAAITVVYVIAVETFIYREVSFKVLYEKAIEAMRMVGAILIILAASLALTNMMVDAQIPQKIFAMAQSMIESKIAFLLVLNVVLLLLGAILDIFSALVIVVPIILPVAMSYGIDPVHLGIIFLANLQIGYLTPPVGMNLFISSLRFNTPITQVYKAALPFGLVLLAALGIITYWEGLSLFLIR